MNQRRTPSATYRLQLCRGFTLHDAAELVPYLDDLGVDVVYASPILRARPGSSHGYDTVDPAVVSPDLGGERALVMLSDALRGRAMDLLCDIVPNHMAAHHDNPWWWDVLERGRASEYAHHFDIDWDAPAARGRIVLPVLGDSLHDATHNGDLQIAFAGLTLRLHYYDTPFPISAASVAVLLQYVLQHHAAAQLPAGARDQIAQIIAVAPPPPHIPVALAQADARRAAAAAFRSQLSQLLDQSSIRSALEAAVKDLATGPDGPARLREILEAQTYELAYWKEGVRRINYRRFFDITDLVSLRAEDPHVFEDSHSTILRLAAEGRLSGLRIDHIDGLRDPHAYLQRLRPRLEAAQSASPSSPGCFPWIVVEKILGAEESLPTDWPCEGTTGYDFLVALNRLFVEPRGVVTLREHAACAFAIPLLFEELARSAKAEALEKLLSAEVDSLTASLADLARSRRQAPRLTNQNVREAVIRVSASLPVYRTYIRPGVLSEQDRARLDLAAALARRAAPDAAAEIDFLQSTLLRAAEPAAGGDERPELRIALRWQQLTGPAAAKGVEDTALYRDVSLLSLNEVGGEPVLPDDPVEEFHRFNAARAEQSPRSLSATSTHDTKRSEDVRARISVLSEIADDWTAAYSRWRELNRPLRADDKRPAPADECLIYQTLLGVWPLDNHPDESFVRRIQEYATKALREAKVRTSWTDPDQAYESGVHCFIGRILDPSRARPFLNDFRRLESRTAFHGMLNALSQTILKLAAPGVPDLYRGAELWDLSLVDPDNRRPVDFDLRRRLLADIRQRSRREPAELASDLLENWRDGRIKLYITWRGLQLRRVSEAFDFGYQPMRATGPSSAHVIACARARGHDTVVAVATRLTTGLVPVGQFPVGEQIWGQTRLPLPDDAPDDWTNVLTGEPITSTGGQLPLGQVFRTLPIALLHAGRPAEAPLLTR